MPHHFIDRRLNPKDKSLGNRQRFLKRVRSQVKRAVDKAIQGGNIADADKQAQVLEAEGKAEAIIVKAQA